MYIQRLNFSYFACIFYLLFRLVTTSSVNPIWRHLCLIKTCAIFSREHRTFSINNIHLPTVTKMRKQTISIYRHKQKFQNILILKTIWAQTFQIQKTSRNCLHFTSIWFRFTTGLWRVCVVAHLVCFAFVFVFFFLYRSMSCVYQVANSGSPLERGFSGYNT